LPDCQPHLLFPPASSPPPFLGTGSEVSPPQCTQPLAMATAQAQRHRQRLGCPVAFNPSRRGPEQHRPPCQLAQLAHKSIIRPQYRQSPHRLPAALITLSLKVHARASLCTQSRDADAKYRLRRSMRVALASSTATPVGQHDTKMTRPRPDTTSFIGANYKPPQPLTSTHCWILQQCALALGTTSRTEIPWSRPAHHPRVKREHPPFSPSMLFR